MNISEIISDFLGKEPGRKSFFEHEVKGLLKLAGLSVPEGVFIHDTDEIEKADGLKYPLVAKVVSYSIASKSDVHGVITGIRDGRKLIETASELFKIPGAEGVLIEEMAPQGIEVVVGGVYDEQFGPVVMFGTGGIFVELYKDVAFGLAPMSEEYALKLIKEVKGYRLLTGYRGMPGIKIISLISVIVIISEFIATGLIKEITLNPVSLYPDGAIVLDAKMLTV